MNPACADLPKAERAAALIRADVIVVGVLLGLQPVATDLYLPALPALTRGLGGTPGIAQFTLSGMLLVFGFGQLFWGSLSDRIGRRPCLLWGLALFSLASLACAAAQNLGVLLVLRLLAGIGLAAPIACGRAVVRDLYSGVAATRVFSAGYAGVGIVAACSAPLGGVLAHYAGWRPTLAMIGMLGMAAFLFVALRFAESLPGPEAGRAERRSYGAVLRDGPFLCFTGLSAASYMGLLAILATSSFVFIDRFGLSPTTYGAIMLAQSLTFIGGTRLCHWLVAHQPLARVVALGGALCMMGGCLSLALAVLPHASPWPFAAANLLYMVGHGINQPGGQSLAVGRFPRNAGLAASVNGVAMALAAFAMGLWIAGGHRDVVDAMARGLAFSGIGAALLGAASMRAARVSRTVTLRKIEDEPAPC